MGDGQMKDERIHERRDDPILGLALPCLCWTFLSPSLSPLPSCPWRRLANEWRVTDRMWWKEKVSDMKGWPPSQEWVREWDYMAWRILGEWVGELTWCRKWNSLVSHPLSPFILWLFPSPLLLPRKPRPNGARKHEGKGIEVERNKIAIYKCHERKGNNITPVPFLFPYDFPLHSLSVLGDPLPLASLAHLSVTSPSHNQEKGMRTDIKIASSRYYWSFLGQF